MIKKVDVIVSFPQGAYFDEHISMKIYQSLLNFIKNISCICSDVRCIDCEEKNMCKYYMISGSNYCFYPGITMDIDLFEKRQYCYNEQKKFSFFLIGNQERFADYISLFFDNMQQMMFGNFFYLKEIKMEVLKKVFIQCNQLGVKSPILNHSFIDEYNFMVQYYNEKYETHFLEIMAHEKAENVKLVSIQPLKIKTHKSNHNGIVGTFIFSESILLDKRLLSIGIGKYNYFGGGRVEIKDSVGK